MEEFKRFEMLIGKENLEKLSKKHIAIFGIGGVGGYVCEALARSGIGNFTLIDNDVVDVSNLNRQIIATTSTIGLPKVEVMKERILSINKKAKINTYQCFFLPENASIFDFSKFDYIVDAIDTVTAKLAIIELAKKNNDSEMLVLQMGYNAQLKATADELTKELERKKIVARSERLESITKELPYLKTID